MPENPGSSGHRELDPQPDGCLLPDPGGLDPRAEEKGQTLNPPDVFAPRGRILKKEGVGSPRQASVGIPPVPPPRFLDGEGAKVGRFGLPKDVVNSVDQRVRGLAIFLIGSEEALVSSVKMRRIHAESPSDQKGIRLKGLLSPSGGCRVSLLPLSIGFLTGNTGFLILESACPFFLF